MVAKSCTKPMAKIMGLPSTSAGFRSHPQRHPPVADHTFRRKATVEVVPRGPHGPISGVDSTAWLHHDPASNKVLLVKIALGRELVSPISRGAGDHPIYHRNLLFFSFSRKPSIFINQPTWEFGTSMAINHNIPLLSHCYPIVIPLLSHCYPIVIPLYNHHNQPDMGIWEIGTSGHQHPWRPWSVDAWPPRPGVKDFFVETGFMFNPNAGLDILPMNS